jgi:hypothetical protein
MMPHKFRFQVKLLKACALRIALVFMVMIEQVKGLKFQEIIELSCARFTRL